MATYYETGRINASSGSRQMYATCTQVKGSSGENKSTINWTIYTVNDSTWYDTGPTTLWIGNNKVYELGRVSWSTGTFPAAAGSVSGSFQINHNADGTVGPLTVTLSTAIETATVSTTSGTWSLDSIARYFTKTPTINLTSRTETSMNFTWNTSEICSEIVCYYKLSNVSSYTSVTKYSSSTGATSGTFNLTGLSPNSTYNIYIRAKRKDSQLYSNSNVNNYITYNYPYIKSISKNPLIIGGQQTAVIYNPLNRTISFYMKQDSTTGTELYTATNISTGAGENINYNFVPSGSVLYNSIKNSQTGNAVYYCTYGGNFIQQVKGIYQVSGNENPTISTQMLSFEEGNPVLSGVVDSFVQLVSIIQINVNEWPVASNGADVLSCKISLGDSQEREVTKADREITPWTKINLSGPVDVTVTATDTRGLSSSRTWTINLLPYSYPTLSANVKRKNNYGTTVEMEVSYVSSTINDSNNINILYGWDNMDPQILYNGIAGSNVIRQDVSDISNNAPHDFWFIISDSFTTPSTIHTKVPIGVPIMFVDSNQNGVGINKFPTVAGLDVDGPTIINGDLRVYKGIDELINTNHDENYNTSIVNTKNLRSRDFIIIGTNSRMEDYEDGTGIFYIG